MREPESATDSALDEHRECMRAVAEVEACLDEHPDRETRWIGRLVPKLEALIETLRGHFHDEERTALYRELPERHPLYAERLQRLVDEHGRILSRASDLVKLAGSLDATRIHELRAFNGGVQLLVARIRRHEAEENEILLGAHWQEFGEGD